jgi:hypothetical protein
MVCLECNAKNCVHNTDNCCCKNEIQVAGDHACRRDETCCESFDERRGDRFTNKVEQPAHVIDVKCTATNCIYNEGSKCNANHISISGSSADRMDETKCASFEMN